MRYLVKIYVGTHFPNDDGTNISVKISADSEEQAWKRAMSLLSIDGMDAEAYETWEID